MRILSARMDPIMDITDTWQIGETIKKECMDGIYDTKTDTYWNMTWMQLKQHIISCQMYEKTSAFIHFLMDVSVSVYMCKMYVYMYVCVCFHM